MLFIVKTKVVDDQIKIAILRYRERVRKNDCCHKTPVEVWISLIQVFPWIINRLFYYFTIASNLRMVNLLSTRAIQPTIPVNYIASWKSQKVAKHNPLCIDLLTALPRMDVGTLFCTLKQVINAYGGKRPKSCVCMSSQKSFDVASI
jgi:hypothetical protein